MIKHFANISCVFGILALIITFTAVASCANKKTLPEENNSTFAGASNRSPITRVQRKIKIRLLKNVRAVRRVKMADTSKRLADITAFCLGSLSNASCVTAEKTCVDSLCVTQIDSGLDTPAEEIRVQVHQGVYITFFNSKDTVAPGVAFKDLGSEIELNLKFVVNTADNAPLEDKFKALELVIARPDLSFGLEMSKTGASFVVANAVDGVINSLKSREFSWKEILSASERDCS